MAETGGWRAALRGFFTRTPPLRAGEDARLGAAGERAAARFLRRAGYRVMERNVRLRAGEIDIICLAPDRRTVVFVEVKTRRAGASVPPEAAVTAHKQRKLLQVARVIARQRGWLERPLRIDVAAVEIPDRGRPVLRHYLDAVKAPPRL